MNVTEIDTGIVQERHRHRYEVNPKYVKNFESWGLNFIGQYLSRPLKPSPAFLGFVSASAGLTIESSFKN
ncbi:6010_t:CDS:2 [Entrophospora sp. SA101]|nr:6010_t:CDS:2 [Entrophospora sp. SA101]